MMGTDGPWVTFFFLEEVQVQIIVSSTRDKMIEENYLFIHAYALNVNHKIYYFACNKIRCK